MRATRLFALGLLAACASCTTAERSVTGPSAGRCSINVTNSMDTAAAAGGSGTLSVDIARDCEWTASSGAAWVVITSASSGQGGGSIAYRVAANPDSAPRRTTIDVNDVKAPINQDAAACRYRVAPLTHDVATGGATIAVDVETHASCDWTAVSEAAWIRINAGAKGKGDGTVTMAVDASSGAARSGTIRVAGQTVTVAQSAVPCTYKIAPAAGTMAAAGGPSTVTVSAAGHCPWTAASNVPWMAVASAAAGSGNGSVQLAIAANSGAARTGTSTIAAQTFTLTQAAAPCTFTVAPVAVEVPTAGGERSVTVTTRGDCAWTAASNAPWISITAGAASTGSGVVRFNSAANGGDARSGVVSVAGQAVTVTQEAAPCTFAFATASQTYEAAGGYGFVGVGAARPTCAWTVVSNNADWLVITDRGAGTGNGLVNFRVGVNSGPQRTGSLSIGDQTFWVIQKP